MTLILRGTVPPIIEISRLGYAAVAVYSLLYQSAYQDQRYDSRKCIRVSEKRDCGGTTNWSHKAIAETLQMGKAKVIASIDLPLDNGFIQHEGFTQSQKDSRHRIYRVVHPEMIDTVRAVMPILPNRPSLLAKNLLELLCIENAMHNQIGLILLKKLIKMTNEKTYSQNNLIDKSQSQKEVIQVIFTSDRGAIRIKQIGRS